jgi:nucleoid DNA-binding protein
MMDEVYASLNYPRVATRKIIWEFLRILYRHLVKGEKVLLLGIGRFDFKEWRIPRDRLVGKKSKVIKWRSSHRLAKELHQNTEEPECTS